MELTNKQEQGLKIAVERYRNKDPYTVISGYAGTGKSTLVQYIVEALNLNPDDVAYIAYTGKAANVLQSKNCPNATTAHKFLYNYQFLPRQKIYNQIPKETLDKNYKLIIVDEISMLPKKMWNLLLSHKVHVIACGDPFQLPPINKLEDNQVLNEPHIFLDEIVRQAAENEIIRFSMDLRMGKPIAYQANENVCVVPYSKVTNDMLLWGDQLIAATNQRRHFLNSTTRDLLKRGKDPEIGDKIICLQNRWDITDNTHTTSLENGTIGTIDKVEFSERQFEKYKDKMIVPVAKISFTTPYGEHFSEIEGDRQALTESIKTLNAKQEQRIRGFNPFDKNIAPVEFNYAYAITCHKAQGSQWDNVVVFEEKYPFDTIEHYKWLYTACTRASENLILVR